jgi:hypothetical protein
MTHTVTLLADHKGHDGPKVLGDEYIIRAKVNITAYRDAAVTSTVNLLNSAETITHASGTALTQPVVGRHITIGSAATGGNDGVKLVTASTATVITVEANGITADATNDEITITPTYELLSASSFGLSTVSSFRVVGQESTLHSFNKIVGTSGETTLGLSSSTLELGATVMSTGANAAVSDLGYIVVEVIGSL